MLISKKDLLAITGISYGQLYRWKRERLIPEEWFIKQSSYTGQETFFPREQILSRIQSIQELKDKYSIEEMAKMLSPEVAPRRFQLEELKDFEEISDTLIPCFINSFEKEEFDYMEVLFMIVISGLYQEEKVPFDQVKELVSGIKDVLREVKSTGMVFALVQLDTRLYGMLYQDQRKILLDERFQIQKEVRMDEISNQIKLKYKEKGWL